MRLVPLATIATALLVVPLAGQAAAETCGADFGPYRCPVKADAGVRGQLDRCYIDWMSLPSNPSYTCIVNWHLSWSGAAVTPGIATASLNGAPSSYHCDWVTTGCSGSTVWQSPVWFANGDCGTGSSTTTLSVTATSTFGQATDSETATVTVASPLPGC